MAWPFLFSYFCPLCRIEIRTSMLFFFLLIVQVGIGHSFLHNTIGWKWKLSTCLGGDGVSQIRNKTSVGLFPGFDLRIGWRAEYILPEIHG